MIARLLSLLLLLVVAGTGWLGFRLLEARLAADVYRERLAELAEAYEAVRTQYNEAVLATAVTELLVTEGSIEVSIRTAEGVLKTIPTPFDPSRELYVDYVVLNDRLWIRRVFDEETPPGDGVVVDPALVEIDWRADGASHGKATYRQLDPGRWVVTVTGDGSLGLARREEGEPVALSAPPPVREYPQIEDRVRSDILELGPRAILEKLLANGRL